MFDRKAHADGLVASTRLPITRVMDNSQSASEWMHYDNDIQFAYMLGLINPFKRNITQPGDRAMRLNLPNVTDDFTYAINMHELGHTIGRTTAELEAWQWAYDNSPVWTAGMTAAVTHGLMSYTKSGLLDLQDVVDFISRLEEKHEQR